MATTTTINHRRTRRAVRKGKRLYEGKFALITGGGTGVGRKLALEAYRLGAHVVLIGLEQEALAATAAECGNAPYRFCDVSDTQATIQAVAQCASELEEEFGNAFTGFDYVVANAGIGKLVPAICADPVVARNTPLDYATNAGTLADQYRKTTEVNFMGTINTVLATWPYMRKGSHYVLTASLAASAHLPFANAYSASKAAVEAYAHGLANEVRPFGVTVGIAFYGKIDNAMTDEAFGNETSKDMPLGEKDILPKVDEDLVIETMMVGMYRHSRMIVAPWWVEYALIGRMGLQPYLDFRTRPHIAGRNPIAWRETFTVPFTTEQPEKESTKV